MYDNSDHNNCPNHHGHINAFLNIRGYPYILNDYLEDITFNHIDTSLISNSIVISNSESGRTIVDISIDNTRPMIGNSIKYTNLIEAVFKSVRKDVPNILPVFQKALIAQINYRIENQRTGKILREASERLSIDTRNYFLNANVQSIDDNTMDACILTNFTDSISTTVTEFLHGSETMICRITGIELFYPAVIYSHHTHSNTKHCTTISNNTTNNPDCQSYQYNDFYHFDNLGKDIHIHQTEIEDNPTHDITLIPVGSMKMDKGFIVNTGQKITFKYSIWKSDVIMVKNTKRIEEILDGAPYPQDDKIIETIVERLDDINIAINNNTNDIATLQAEVVKSQDIITDTDITQVITEAFDS